MALRHVSLTARDAATLSRFCEAVFEYVDRRPPRRLSGPCVTRGNGVTGVDIVAHWLHRPDTPEPVLEILQHSVTAPRQIPAVNEPGWGHLAFTGPDINAAISRVLTHGGTAQGEITNFGPEDAPILLTSKRNPLPLTFGSNVERDNGASD